MRGDEGPAPLLGEVLKSGFWVRMRFSFFSRRQPLSCFSRAMDWVMLSWRS